MHTDNSTPWIDRFGTHCFVAFFIVMGAIMATHVSNIAGGADPSCYLELSRLIMHGDFSPPLRPVAGLPLETFPPNLYAPISYAPRPDYSGLIPTGFPGLPLVYSLADVVLPTPWAIGVVVWSTMMGCGALVYVLLRDLGFRPGWACLGGISMGVSPLTVFIGSVPLSDPLTCCLATACWILALRAVRGRGWAAALGFALGLAVLTRAPNVIAFVPVTVVLMSHGWRRVPWGFIVLGGAPCAIFLGAYNLTIHQHLFTTTGYSNAGALFHLRQFPVSLRHYAQWLPTLYPIVALAPLSWLLVRRFPAIVATAWTWVIVYVVFYAPYFASSENWYILRYIMPAAVGLIVAAVLVLREAEAVLIRWIRRPAAGGFLSLLLAAGAIGYGAWEGERLNAYIFRRNEVNILEVVEWLGRSTTRDDAFLCFQFTGSMHYYTDRSFLRHERLNTEGWRKVAAAAQAGGRDVFGIFYVFEFHDVPGVQARFPGTWEHVFQSRDGVIRVFRLTAPAESN